FGAVELEPFAINLHHFCLAGRDNFLGALFWAAPLYFD
ncbi:MAG: hypothetical protein RLY97_1109, partial [Pseudomonadota bacterium]